VQFSQIYGHDETKKLLIGSVQNRHVAHAQLFLGPPGSPNLALALAYATYINCENRQPDDSCGTCASCSKMNKLVHPDFNFIFPVTTTKKEPKDATSQKFLPEWREFVHASPYQSLNEWMQFIGAENKQGNISREESRQLIRLISLKPFEAEFKIILIWLPELMQAPTANALLKMLEEPPGQTVFLLVAHDSEKLLATILSRTQIMKIRPFTEEEVVAWLTERHSVNPVVAGQIAQLAEGNLQEAVVLSSQMTSDYFSFFVDWMRHCYGYKFTEVIEMSEDFQKMGRESQKTFLQYALNTLRRVLLYSIDPALVVYVPPAELDFISKFSRFIHATNAGQLSEQLNQAHYHIERNANPKMVFVDTSVFIARYLRIPRQEPIAEA
jgi:DNA polymerase-3 subunit delta'